MSWDNTVYMNDRKTILLALAVAVMLEITFLVRSGLLTWVMSGPHTSDEVHHMMTDWRVIASVVLVTVIVWLVHRLTKVWTRPTGDPNQGYPS